MKQFSNLFVRQLKKPQRGFDALHYKQRQSVISTRGLKALKQRSTSGYAIFVTGFGAIKIGDLMTLERRICGQLSKFWSISYIVQVV
jgi:hypothetical protein